MQQKILLHQSLWKKQLEIEELQHKLNCWHNSTTFHVLSKKQLAAKHN